MSERPVTILTVDDEPEIVDIITQYLAAFDYTIFSALNAERAREILDSVDIDIAILDVNLPGEDGLSLAQHLRETQNCLIMMLTAMGTPSDRKKGFEQGADDYLTKPFEPRELLARVRSLERRLPSRIDALEETVPKQNEARVPIGTCHLDLEGQSLVDVAGEEIAITAMEFDLLKVFIEHPNRVLSRDQLAEFAHHREWSPDDRSIDIRIARLRKKIEADPNNPVALLTIRGIGYKFVTAN